MTKETAEALGIIIDRLTRPLITIMLVVSVCWIGLRTVNNISADQFVGIIMAVVMFWFGQRPTTSGGTNGPPMATGRPDSPVDKAP